MYSISDRNKFWGENLIRKNIPLNCHLAGSESGMRKREVKKKLS